MTHDEAGLERWRGLVALGRDLVDSGAAEIEKVHLATAARTFTVLEAIEPLRAPAHLVRSLHDAGVAASYGAVRVVTRLVAGVADSAMVLAASRRAARDDGEQA